MKWNERRGQLVWKVNERKRKKKKRRGDVKLRFVSAPQSVYIYIIRSESYPFRLVVGCYPDLSSFFLRNEMGRVWNTRRQGIITIIINESQPHLFLSFFHISRLSFATVLFEWHWHLQLSRWTLTCREMKWNEMCTVGPTRSSRLSVLSSYSVLFSEQPERSNEATRKKESE